MEQLFAEGDRAPFGPPDFNPAHSNFFLAHRSGDICPTLPYHCCHHQLISLSSRFHFEIPKFACLLMPICFPALVSWVWVIGPSGSLAG